jgi:copper chaperone CopZ
MKKAIIQGMCCPGCAKDVKAVLSGIYGISNVQVFLEQGYALFDGYVSKEVIAATLEREGYHLVDIVKER